MIRLGFFAASSFYLIISILRTYFPRLVHGVVHIYAYLLVFWYIFASVTVNQVMLVYDGTMPLVKYSPSCEIHISAVKRIGIAKRNRTNNRDGSKYPLDNSFFFLVHNHKL